MREQPAIDACLSDLTGLPRDEAGPVFRQPWEAQAFAIVHALKQAGLFTSTEWADALAAEIGKAQAAGDEDRGDTYYLHWLAAIEHLVCEKGLTSLSDLSRYQEAWRQASRRIPHGQPITLSDEDFT